MESLHRDPGSGQAQLNEADLQQQLGTRHLRGICQSRIVNMMEYYEFDARIAFRAVCILLRDASIMMVLFCL